MNSYRNSHTSFEISSTYDAKFKYRVDSLIWDDFVKPYVRSILKKSAHSKSDKYMDFACGTGRLLKLGNSVFGHASGIDISKNMLSVARKRVPNAKLYCLDVTREDSKEIGEFDCVTMFRFLKNAEPELREEVLRWLYSHMPKGATLIVNNHGNSSSLQGLVTRLAFWLPDELKNLLSRRETQKLLKNAGFDVVSCEGFRILPSLFGRPVFGRWLQSKLERFCRQLNLGRFGGELVFVAIRR